MAVEARAERGPELLALPLARGDLHGKITAEAVERTHDDVEGGGACVAVDVVAADASAEDALAGYQPQPGPALVLAVAVATSPGADRAGMARARLFGCARRYDAASFACVAEQ